MTFAISELPVGYDMAINESNQVYFLNHQTQETTWYDLPCFTNFCEGLILEYQKSSRSGV